MKTYLLTLLLISLLSGALLWLFSSSRYEKHLRYLCSLVLLVALAAPIKNVLSSDLPALFDSLPEEQTYSGSFGTALKEESEALLEEQLSDRVRDRLGLSKNDFSIDVAMALSGTELSLVCVRTNLKSLRAVSLREEMKKVFEDLHTTLYFIEDL